MKRTSPSLVRLLSLFTCALIIQCQLSASLAFTTKDLGSRTRTESSHRSTTTPHRSVAAPVATFSNTTSFTIADRTGAVAPPGVASLYPSPILVSGMSGAVADVNVTIFGLSSTRPRDLDFLLESPTGEKFVIIADAGGLCAISNVDITLDDSAATLLPDSVSGPPCAPVITTGSYRPANYIFGAELETFPAPAPAGPYAHAAPTGGATFASSFNGVAANGTWNLYAVDDSLGGGVSSVSGGWSIEVTTDENVSLTSTAIASSANPALTTQSVTFTATVTSGGNPVTEGSVSFTNNGVAIAGCSGVAVDGNGQATCVTMLAEGTRTITAQYGGTPSFGMSNGSLSQVVNGPTVANGAQFCNNGGISIFDPPGGTSPYPSNISVSGLFGTVGSMSVDLIGLTSPRPNNLDFLLVGPGGQAFLIMSDVGDLTAATGINLTLTDSAPGLMPIGTPLSGGTYRPTDSAVLGQPDLFPAPAPGSFSLAAPAGSATFGSVYGGTQPNGTWSLYSIDDSVGGGATSVTGWCVNFAVTPVATSTTLVSSLNPSNVGDSVTFTATVTSSAGTPTGTVEFFDGLTSLGTDTLDGAGEATLTTSALTSGSHNITAQYLGASVGSGGGGYAASTSNTVVQVVRTAPTANPDAYATNEDQPLNVASPGVLGNDTDPDPGATLTAVLVSGPSNAQSFTLNADGSFSYTPAPNFFGSDSFTYKARDNTNLDSNTTTVSITVNAVDDGPEVTVSGGGTCGSGAATGTINLTVSDSDTPAANLTLSATSSNTTLVPNANITFGGSGASRTMTVVANAPGTIQSSTITITVSDGQGGSNQITVTVIVGTTSADNISGTSGADMIFGRQDGDTINAGGGNDLVCAGSGNDVVNGGSGNDTLDGEHGDDTLRGEDGNDILRGDNGVDTLEGGNDDDTLTGGSGADSFSGGPGTDTTTDFNPGQGDTQDGSLGWLIPDLNDSVAWLTAD